MDSETQKAEPLYEFLAWLEVNKKRVIIGTVAVLGVAGIVSTFLWYKKQQELSASEALSSIRIPYSPNEPLPPDTVSKLQKVSAEFSGTSAAIRAELMAASLLYTEGKYAEAQAAFEKFGREHPESPWAAEAFYGIAVALDAQDKAADAATKYNDFITRHGTLALADQARLNLAFLYETTGKAAQAVELYEKLGKAAVAGSPFASEAQERMRALLSKHPELTPTNALPAVTPKPSPISLVKTTVVNAVSTNLSGRTNVPPLKITPMSQPPAAAAPVKK